MARTFLQPSAPEARPVCGAPLLWNAALVRPTATALFTRYSRGARLAFGAGKGDNKKEFSHVELRARAAVHLQKHRAEYESEWDGIMPDGGTGKTFDDYLEAIRQLGQFASELEVRALARIYNTRVLIVPGLGCFCAHGFPYLAATKRMLVLWLENKHLEFLKPKGESTTCKDYPEEHWKVTDGPVKGIRVGGSDEASSLRSGTVWSPAPQSAKARSGRQAPPASSASCSLAADTVWTRQAHTTSQEVSAGTLHSKAGQGTADTSSVGEHRACEDPPPVPEAGASQAPQVPATGRR